MVADTIIEFSLADLSALIDAEAQVFSERSVALADIQIQGIGILEDAGQTQIGFVASTPYREMLLTTSAAAVIVDAKTAEWFTSNQNRRNATGQPPIVLLLVEQPYAAYAVLSRLWDSKYPFSPGIHPTAVVDDSAQLGEGCFVGANAVIEAHADIAEGVYVGAGSYVGRKVRLGRDTRLWPKVVCYPEVTIGERCIVHSGTILGADGFGNANVGGKWHKIAQLGGLGIGDDVEIGANCCIDRGALGDTIIDDGVRVDNLVQVAHNVHIGAHTAIAACTGIAGSASIGMRCNIGGGSGINGHIMISDDVHLTGMAMVTHDLSRAGVYSSGTGIEENRAWRKMVARLKQLDDVVRRFKRLEKRLG